MALNRPVRHRVRTQISQHPQGIDLARRLHNAGNHQIPEHLIVDDVEPDPVINGADHVIEQPRAGRRGPPRCHRRALGHTGGQPQRAGPPIGDIADPHGTSGHLEIQDILITGGDTTGPLHQNPKLSIGMGRTDMLDQHVTTTRLAHHLHRHRARRGADLAHEHPPDPTRLVSQNPPTTTQICRSQNYRPRKSADVS